MVCILQGFWSQIPVWLKSLWCLICVRLGTQTMPRHLTDNDGRDLNYGVAPLNAPEAPSNICREPRYAPFDIQRILL